VLEQAVGLRTMEKPVVSSSCPSDAWDTQVARVLVLCLDGNQRWTAAAKVREVSFAEKRKERPLGGHTVGPRN
jgi:hypothetical protein